MQDQRLKQASTFVTPILHGEVIPDLVFDEWAADREFLEDGVARLTLLHLILNAGHFAGEAFGTEHGVVAAMNLVRAAFGDDVHHAAGLLAVFSLKASRNELKPLNA